MRPVIIFAGTIEGRMLSEFLSGKGISVTACVATDYGETLLTENEYLRVHAGRMDQQEMAAFLREKDAELVVDATHPYAVEVSRNVAAACAEAGKEYIRLIREQDTWNADGAVVVDSVDEAVEYLKDKEGNILATTGSKELHKYTAIPDYEKRVFARVLSTGQVAAACEKLGFVGKNLICMQGPFSEELNTALLRQFDCKYLVTKETGKAGGFGEKVRAARKAGAQLVLVGRPTEQEGYSYAEVLRLLEERLKLQGISDNILCELSSKPSAGDGFLKQVSGDRSTGEMQTNGHRKIRLVSCEEEETSPSDATTGEKPHRRVTLIGIGMGTPEGMTVEAVCAIHEADLLIGAKRMLDVADAPEKASYMAYNADEIADYIAQHPEYSHVAILLSGDIGFYSGAKKLYDALDGKDYEIRSLCGISSVVYFCGKLHVAWEDVCLLSTHGREANLVAAVKSHARCFTLLSAKDSVKKLCEELIEYGLGGVTVYIGERLGYEEERISSGSPAELLNGGRDGLCVALIENPSPFTGLRCCISDEEFLRGKAPMTKSEIRSLSVAKLQLTKDAVVYDVGAGTGSVTIELALAACGGRVYAVERNEEACSLIEENKRRFGTPNIQVIHGLAPEALENLPAPTHVFVGGSAGNLKEILQCILQKNPSVRLVINTVTLETIGEVTDCLKELPLIEEEIISVSVARAKALGSYHLMMGQNPIYIVTLRGGIRE